MEQPNKPKVLEVIFRYIMMAAALSLIWWGLALLFFPLAPLIIGACLWVDLELEEWQRNKH